MNQAPTVPVAAHTLDVPGARLHYEVRGAGPLVMAVGSPMDASRFAPLSDLLAADYTVVTADPRGAHRSRLDDLDQESTPEVRADDLARIIADVDAGPAMVFGSSGGAVNALALLQAHPALVTTVVAHEPPLDELLENRAEMHEETERIVATYLAGDHTGAWRKFLAKANIVLPDEVFEQIFGGERGPDEHYWFAHELRHTTHWRPDLDLLRTVRDRIVVAIGDESAGQECDHTSRALSAELGVDPVIFPGDHTGFMDHPELFAARLREVLRSADRTG
ncbi:alpha/beta fold hydrolase [Phytoactinopolyspora limicola]|uniref:alpha/beta fold hydrolase n=1 Tax=Phytoactinopolyspora limicola TaxID=2715536 RepID=UPI00140D5DAF|nr:alpha/beta hydrolase [Phytoactinopolyspora limicola]